MHIYTFTYSCTKVYCFNGISYSSIYHWISFIGVACFATITSIYAMLRNSQVVISCQNAYLLMPQWDNMPWKVMAIFFAHTMHHFCHDICVSLLIKPSLLREQCIYIFHSRNQICIYIVAMWYFVLPITHARQDNFFGTREILSKVNNATQCCQNKQSKTIQWV